MKDLKKMLEETNGLYSKIDCILKSSTYDDYDDLSGLDIDYRDGEQLFLLECYQTAVRSFSSRGLINFSLLQKICRKKNDCHHDPANGFSYALGNISIVWNEPQGIDDCDRQLSHA